MVYHSHQASSATSAPAAPRFYSVAAAARMFGISSMTLYRAIKDGEFPAVRIRGRVIVPANAVEAMAETAGLTAFFDKVDKSATAHKNAGGAGGAS